MFTRTSISTNRKSRPLSARTSSLCSLLDGQSATRTGRFCLTRGVLSGMHATKHWQGCAEGRRLGAMTGTISSGSRNEKNGWLRVLGGDPAATGPTGYGVVENDRGGG